MSDNIPAPTSPITLRSAARLRSEALPLTWLEMDNKQRRAFEHVASLLRRSIDGINAGQSEIMARTLPVRLDRNRSSRVVCLSGERGTGKTSVLLSLMWATASPDQWDSKSNGGPEYDSIRQLLAPLRNRVVWLQTLDLQPLSGPTNILAAILERIDGAANRFRGRDREKPAPEVPYPPEAREPLLKLAQLRADVALAWDGNAPMYGPGVDPDVYAQEVLRAEYARTSVETELGAVLDGVAENVFSGPNVKDPIFVLPIDDFDLNPMRALDILRLIRMISVPRLFTIFLGDINAAEVALHLHLSGEFGDAARSATQADAWSLSKDDVLSLVGSLAAEGLRKLIPPGQRVELGRMSIPEALSYKPANDEPTLRGLLERCPAPELAPIQERPRNFSEFLLLEHLGRSAELAYSGAHVLRGPRRHVIDLWYELAHSQVRTSADPEAVAIQDVVGNELGRAVAEDQRLSPQNRTVLREAIRKNSRGWELDCTEIESSTLPGVGVRILSGQYFIHARIADGWSLSVNADRRSKLSWRSAAWLVLFHDLLALDPRGGLIAKHLAPSPFVGWATTEWISDSTVQPVVLHWPTPPWASFWQFDHFASLWNSAVRRIRSRSPMALGEAPVRELAFVWIEAMTAVILGTTKIRDATAGDAWTLLIEDIVKVLKSAESPVHRDAATTLAWTLIMLLTPELGISEEVATLIAAQPELQRLWAELRPGFRLYRRENFRRFIAAGADRSVPRMFGVIPLRLEDVLRRSIFPVSACIMTKKPDLGAQLNKILQDRAEDWKIEAFRSLAAEVRADCPDEASSLDRITDVLSDREESKRHPLNKFVEPLSTRELDRIAEEVGAFAAAPRVETTVTGTPHQRVRVR